MTLIIRNAASQANPVRPGDTTAPLTPAGRNHAWRLRAQLPLLYGVHPNDTGVAVSTLSRTGDTAVEAGFAAIHSYHALDETTAPMTYADVSSIVIHGKLPKSVYAAAQAVLANPPTQQVWITHGLLIAALTDLVGHRDRYPRLLPEFCEIRDLPIGEHRG